MSKYKKWQLSIVFFLVFVLYGWSSFPFQVYFDEIYLTKRLILNSEQQDQIKKIMIMVGKQKINDRAIYKDDPEALYRLALQRRKLQDTLITKTLSAEQKDIFRNLQLKRDLNSEFFIINEILDLNKQQVFRIQNILDEYKKKLNALLELKKYQTKGKNSGKNENRRGASLRNSMKNSGARKGGLGNRRDPSFDNSQTKNLNKDMYIKIGTLLNKTQKKWFPKIKEILNLNFIKNKELRKKRKQ